MLLSNFLKTKSISFTVTVYSAIAVSNFVFINAANAFTVTFDNGSFEQSIGGGSQNSWNTIGDVTNTGNFNINGSEIIQPTSGSNQAVITTGHNEGTFSGVDRNDDHGFKYNISNVNPVSADTNPNADFLQEHFGFGTDAFSIDRSISNSSLGDFRTSKEGSGMYQEFDVTLGGGETSFTIAFDWAFTTNDGATTLGGNQDFAFWSLGQYNPATSTYTTSFDGINRGNNGTFDTDEVDVLRSSGEDGTAIIPPTAVDDYIYDYDYPDLNNPNSTNTDNTREIFTVNGLTPGQTYRYRVGFGVVDVDGLDRTSTLYVDNVEVIPFDFSPTFGLALIASIFGINHLTAKLRSKNNNLKSLFRICKNPGDLVN